MKPSDVGFGRFFFRVTACHMVTYMAIAGDMMPLTPGCDGGPGQHA